MAAFRSLLYTFRGDAAPLIRESRRADREVSKIGDTLSAIGDDIGRIGGGLGTALGAMRGLQQVASQFREQLYEANREIIEIAQAAGLIGAGPANAQAWITLQRELPESVGYLQAFDTGEALQDAARVKPAEVIGPLLDAIGLDRDEVIGAATPLDVSNLLLDALVARGGSVDSDVLAAASEIGAGDLRDFSALAAVVAEAPEYHPRRLAEFYAPTAPTRDETRVALEQNLERARYERIGESSPFDSPIDALFGGALTLDDAETYGRLEHMIATEPGLGRRGIIIPEHAQQPQPVAVVVRDSTAGGIEAARRQSDNADLGAVVDAESQRTPGR